MKHFEASGFWFSPDSASKQVAGTLKFDQEGLILSLHGSLREGWSAEPELYPVIQGVLGKSPYGSFVTLINGFRSSHNFNMAGVTSEKIRSDFAVIGDHHLSGNVLSSRKMELAYTPLKEWGGRGGIDYDHKKVDGEPQFVATYSKPKNLVFPFENGTLTLSFTLKSSRGMYDLSLKEDAAIQIKPMGDLQFEALVPHQVRTIQNLLTLATDTPNDIEDISFQGENNEHGRASRVNLIYSSLVHLDKKDDLFHTDMLFNLEDCQAEGLNIFEAWRAFSNKHKAFCEVYFGYMYAKPRYLDDQLAKALAALTLLSSNLTSNNERTSRFLAEIEAALQNYYGEEDQALIEPVLPTAPELEMPVRLVELIKVHSDLMGQLIDHPRHFAQSLMNTHGFFERRSMKHATPLRGAELYHAIQKINLLIKIIVLKDLGFTAATVKSLIEKNRQFQYFRTV